MKTKLILCIAILSMFSFYSCGNKTASLENKPCKKEEIKEGAITEKGINQRGPINLNDFFIAKLTVVEKIYTHRTGNMEVWIGAKEFDETTPDGYKSNSMNIPSNKGQYVRITPIAHQFEVTPLSSPCLKLDPTGISEKFTLKPLKGTHGKVDVSARVELFYCEDCSKSYYEKVTKDYTISVKISIISLLYQLWDIIWDNFIAFFSTLCALVFGIIIFKIRKKSGMEKE